MHWAACLAIALGAGNQTRSLMLEQVLLLLLLLQHAFPEAANSGIFMSMEVLPPRLHPGLVVHFVVSGSQPCMVV